MCQRRRKEIALLSPSVSRLASPGTLHVPIDPSFETVSCAVSPLIGAAIADPSNRMECIIAVRQALAALTANERELLALRFVEDCALEEIARRLCCRNAWVKERLQVVYARLRALLADCR
jgi:RNA polymerase sigma factor (sigma-70 family)